VTPDRTARGSGNWDASSFLSREDMDAEITQLKKSVAALQDEKMRLKTGYVRWHVWVGGFVCVCLWCASGVG